VQAEQRWEQIQAQFTPTIEVLDHLATRTERVADALDEAGRAFGGQAGDSGSGVQHGHEPALPGDPTPVQPPSTPTHPGLPTGTTNPAALKGTAGCTNYVLSRVNLDAMNRWPNAYQWDETAAAAGFPVGKEPAAGSAIVFEPGVMGANGSMGHVAYVEQVTQQGDLYHVTISEANVAYDASGNVMWGDHTPPTTRQIDFKMSPDGHLTDAAGKSVDGVSFIYGKGADPAKVNEYNKSI
jgi:surface antigen